MRQKLLTVHRSALTELGRGSSGGGNDGVYNQTVSASN